VSLVFPLGLAALGALVPLIALYLLKQKRIEVKVPTNFLWARALEDLRASSLFQRLRATLLLLLQAAAIALFALAAAGASLDLRVGDVPRRLIVLVDRSASMKCVDEDGRSRLDAAKDIARAQVNSLSGADEMMLVAFDARAEVAAASTSDKERLLAVLDRLAARDLGTKAAEALMLAVSFARASQGFDPEILLLSDGGIETELPPVPFPVRYARCGRGGTNQGIVGLQVSRTPGEDAQVYVRVENGSAEPAERTLLLRKGSESVDARAVKLPAGESATVYFHVPEPDGREPVVLQAVLDGGDLLASDDSATFVLRPAVPRTGLLVAPEESIYLDPQRLERLHPGLALTRVSPADAATTLKDGTVAIDFVCYDGVAPAELPRVAAQLYVGCVPPGSGLVQGPTQEFPIVLDWDRTHPTMARCQFDDLLVTESPKLSGHERSRVLIDSTGGPLALLTPVPGREVVVLAFSPAKSNFPLKLSWPLFLANTLDFLLMRTEREGEEPLLATGTPLAVSSKVPTRFTSPSGETSTVKPDARGRCVLSATHEAGLWRVAADGAPEQVHAFALLDASESHVAPRALIVIGGEKVAAVVGDLQRNLLLRDPLLLAALGILTLEWAVWCSRR